MARKPQKPGSHVGRDEKHRNKSCLSHHQRPKPKKEPRTKKQRAAAKRAKRKKVAGWHNRKLWEARLAYFGWRCWYCGSRSRLTKDHRIPKARGGTDWPSNLVPACLPCNERKADRDLDDFLGDFSPWD